MPPGVVSASGTDGDRVAASVAAAQYATGLPLQGTSRRLVWSGTLGGLPTDLVDVVASTGGHAVVAVQGSAMPGGNMTAVHVSAAAKDRPVLMAWTYQGMQPVGQDTWRTGGPFNVGLLGPSAAVRAVVTTAGGTVDVDLADGVGWVQADGARSVEFLGPDGSSLGTAKVKQPDLSATLGPVVTG